MSWEVTHPGSRSCVCTAEENGLVAGYVESSSDVQFCSWRAWERLWTGQQCGWSVSGQEAGLNTLTIHQGLLISPQGVTLLYNAPHGYQRNYFLRELHFQTP